MGDYYSLLESRGREQPPRYSLPGKCPQMQYFAACLAVGVETVRGGGFGMFVPLR